MKQSFESEMEKCRVLIYGVNSNQSIKERIAAIYPEERLALGEELYQSAKTAAGNQGTEKDESKGATRLFRESRDAIHAGLIIIRQAGRYFFKNELNLQLALNLDQDVPASFAGWKTLVENTLTAVQNNEEIQAKFTLVGITAEEIANYMAAVGNIEQLSLNAEKEDGEAQQATQLKQETFDELKAYCSDLRECLALFYRGNDRQKLEEIGIIVK